MKAPSPWRRARTATALVLLAGAYVTLWSLHPSLLLSNTTITGGDTASHVAAADYLRHQWGSGSLTPWYPSWFDGMPLYSYYFVLPDAIAGLLSYVVHFNVAFKIMTVLGSVLLPLAIYAMARLFGARRPIPVALAVVSWPFLFDSTFTIDGGNLFSTMAGEYAFSLSLALAVVTIGLFARGIRTGRGRWWAALALSATLAAHVLPWFYALAIVALLLVLEWLGRWWRLDAERPAVRAKDSRHALGFTLGAGLLSAGLSAWWLWPFVTSQSFANSMGYTNNATDFHSLAIKFGFLAEGAPSTLSWWNFWLHPSAWGGDWWLLVGTLLALFFAMLWRDRLGLTVTLGAALSALAYVACPQGVIFNERLVPFWFLSAYLSTGWLVGAALSRWVDAGRSAYDSDEATSGTSLFQSVRDSRASLSTLFVGFVGLLLVVTPMVPALASALSVTPNANQVPNWASWNYSGVESKSSYPEFHDLVNTMTRVSRTYGCGQSMWEYNADQQRFGSPMALMTLPMWTNNCVGSMEGLFFESSPTTPYHFLNQSELSLAPSRPQVGLNYGSLDVAQGVRHLQLLGVKYFLAFSPAVIAQASADQQLVPVALTQRWPAPGYQWHIYLIRHSAVVRPLTYQPTVISGVTSRTAWLALNQAWWLDPASWATPMASDGPASWPRRTLPSCFTSLVACAPSHFASHVAAGVTRVSHVHIENERLDFNVSRLGVPVQVAVSYFPRWHAVGAEGPYRVSPNLMVVVPTSHHVTLSYGPTTTVTVANVVTDVTVLAGLVVLWRRRPWRRPRVAR